MDKKTVKDLLYGITPGIDATQEEIDLLSGIIEKIDEPVDRGLREFEAGTSRMLSLTRLVIRHRKAGVVDIRGYALPTPESRASTGRPKRSKRKSI